MSAAGVQPPPPEMLAILAGAERVLLSSHANPDGDAIGSELGLARLLRQNGKRVTVWNADPTPTVYRVLPGADQIHVGEEPPAGFSDFDLAIPLECPSTDRTGLASAIEQLPLLNIDHHLGNTQYGEAQWIDTAAPSAGEMVLHLARAMGYTVDPTTATLLYLTLVTDTGGFRFSNATARAFRSAAELVDLGAEPETVSMWIYESLPVGTLRLLREMMGSLELHDEGRIASVELTPDMFEAAGATKEESEGLIDYPRAIAGVDAVAMFRTLPEGDIKVSLRSRGRTNVAAIAERNGGGGHRNAAGCVIDPADAGSRAAILDALRTALREADQGDT